MKAAADAEPPRLVFRNQGVDVKIDVQHELHHAHLLDTLLFDIERHLALRLYASIRDLAQGLDYYDAGRGRNVELTRPVSVPLMPDKYSHHVQHLWYLLLGNHLSSTLFSEVFAVWGALRWCQLNGDIAMPERRARERSACRSYENDPRFQGFAKHYQRFAAVADRLDYQVVRHLARLPLSRYTPATTAWSLFDRIGRFLDEGGAVTQGELAADPEKYRALFIEDEVHSGSARMAAAYEYANKTTEDLAYAEEAYLHSIMSTTASSKNTLDAFWRRDHPQFIGKEVITFGYDDRQVWRVTHSDGSLIGAVPLWSPVAWNAPADEEEHPQRTWFFFESLRQQLATASGLLCPYWNGSKCCGFGTVLDGVMRHTEPTSAARWQRQGCLKI